MRETDRERGSDIETKRIREAAVADCYT